MAKYYIIIDMNTNTIKQVNSITTTEERYVLNDTDNEMHIIKDFTTAPQIGDNYTVSYAEKRIAEYRLASDPLFIAYQAQLQDTSSTQADIDAAKQAWLDKRNEIKAKYPKT